jgi:predicted nuclease of predicted toxin-antitoxin system
VSQCPTSLGFLIDESLCPELADLATARGFRAVAVSRSVRLRGRGDAVIAAYAIDNDMTVVTNNAVDFERIYVRREIHPGLILICSHHSKLRKKAIQLEMMRQALDEVERDSLCQEVLRLTARLSRADLLIDLERFFLPELAAAEVLDDEC